MRLRTSGGLAPSASPRDGRACSPSHWLLALGVFGLSTLGASTASAQTVNLATTGFSVYRETQRASGEYPYWINYKDCLDGLKSSKPTKLRFAPALTGFKSSMNLQIWVSASGTDCTTKSERQSTTGTCGLLYSAVPRLSGETIEVAPQDVAEALSTLKAQSYEGVGDKTSMM